jgi:hypothetical protein
VATLIFATGRAEAQDYAVDLATHPGGELTITIAPNAFSVVVLHRLPGRTYTVTALTETIPIPVLTLPTGVKIPIAAAGDIPCMDLEAKIKALGEPKDEQDVARLADGIGSLLQSTQCSGPSRDNAAALLATYSAAMPVGTFTVSRGQQLRIVVQRLKEADKTVEKTWTTILSTGSRGQWLTTYGVTFVPLRDELFFAKAGATQGQYVITAQRADAQSGIKFLPSVLFSWLPATTRFADWAFSPTAGFGATSDAFSALVGYTATYNSNLGFSAGVAVAQQRRLLGQYSENQIVTENLTEDQLHHRVLKPAFFVSLTFRFGENPFGSPSDGKGGDNNKADAKPVK